MGHEFPAAQGKCVEDLKLVGYTADLRHLVVARDDEPGVRLRLPVDEQLCDTLGEVLDVLDTHTQERLLRALGPRVPSVLPSGPSAAAGVLAARESEHSRDSEDDAAGPVRLSPKEVQALLRAGRPPETVARQAGADLAWVERWSRPIAAEQQQVIAAVRNARQVKPRLGPSHHLIGPAVDANLRARGIDPEDEAVRWTAARQHGRDYWTVTLRFREHGVTQRAVWRYQVPGGGIVVANDMADALGWTMAPGQQHQPTSDGTASDGAVHGQAVETGPVARREDGQATRSLLPRRGSEERLAEAARRASRVQRRAAAAADPWGPHAARRRREEDNGG